MFLLQEKKITQENLLMILLANKNSNENFNYIENHPQVKQTYDKLILTEN